MNSELLEQLLAKAEAAKSPEERAWIATESLLQSLEPELQQACWAVAVPHWFDAEIVGILCPELKEKEAEIYSELQTLPFVEVFPDRGHNIHEATRKQILEKLWRDEREKFLTLSARAAEYFANNNDSTWQIECLYHLAVGDFPRNGILVRQSILRRISNFIRKLVKFLAGEKSVADVIWDYFVDWNNTFRYGELDSLANVLFEQALTNRVSPKTKVVIYSYKGQAERRAYQNPLEKRSSRSY